MTAVGVERLTPADAVRRAHARMAEVDRPEAWIHVAPLPEVLAAAAGVQARLDAGEHLPLAGLTVGVKDNIDVAGMPTTAGCPAFAYRPERSAVCVERLMAAGAVVIGKTALDQFATGLSGARSPFGAVRNAIDPAYISGGSSSGSGVAVALGVVDLGIGTDTAGSGRVPAALNGIVGAKPTYGLIPTLGVVPACASLDCVTVFATTVAMASSAVDVMAGTHPGDSRDRDDQRAGHPALLGGFRFGVARKEVEGCHPQIVAVFDAAVARLRDLGGTEVDVDLTPFQEAGSILYDGSFVAERYAAVGEFVESHPDDVDPTVHRIITGAKHVTGQQLLADRQRLLGLHQSVMAAFGDMDVLVLPTTPTTFTIEEMQAQPLERNAALGKLGDFANLVDLCATVVPVRRADGLSAGITIMAPAWHDHVTDGLAARFMGEPVPAPTMQGRVALAVVGAHLHGQPLHWQLSDRNAVLLSSTTTSGAYRLHALDTVPPKPGLVRVAEGGAPIELEVYGLTVGAFGSFVAAVPPPMVIGTVELADGTWVKGFLCEAGALEGAPDITAHGGWRKALAAGL